MPGAQGAQSKGSFTATTYHTAPTAATEDPSKMAIRSDKDEPGVSVKDAAGLDGPVFGAGADDGKPDLGDASTESLVMGFKRTSAAGLGGPVFGAGTDDGKPDLGVAGTG
ncbi:uncharacterized protein LOC144548880 [Carex rostrata]